MSMLKKVDGDIELYEPSNGLTHLIADGSGNVEIPNGDTLLGGNTLQEVGGTTDASSGAIRLANGSAIKGRNQFNNADVNLIGVDSNDNINIGSATSVSLNGTVLTQVGSTTDANSGQIRLGNTDEIAWRSDSDSFDSTIRLNSLDQIVIGNGNEISTQIDSELRTNDGLYSDLISNRQYRDRVTVDNFAGGGSTTLIDLSLANVHRLKVTGNMDISFADTVSEGNSVLIYFIDKDGNGPFTISWPSSVVWSNGNAVTEVPANGDVEVTLISDDGGSEWRGRKSGESFA